MALFSRSCASYPWRHGGFRGFEQFAARFKSLDVLSFPVKENMLKHVSWQVFNALIN